MTDSEYLSREDARGHLKVLEVLRKWDPIGVYKMESNWPLDEYDSYAPQIIRLLDAGGNERQVAAELQQIASLRIGMNSPWAHHLDIAKELVDFWRTWKP